MSKKFLTINDLITYPICNQLSGVLQEVSFYLQGEDMKCSPEMGETAIQPLPAQTADSSISGLRLTSPLCIVKLSSISFAE